MRSLFSPGAAGSGFSRQARDFAYCSAEARSAMRLTETIQRNYLLRFRAVPS